MLGKHSTTELYSQLQKQVIVNVDVSVFEKYIVDLCFIHQAPILF